MMLRIYRSAVDFPHLLCRGYCCASPIYIAHQKHRLCICIELSPICFAVADSAAAAAEEASAESSDTDEDEDDEDNDEGAAVAAALDVSSDNCLSVKLPEHATSTVSALR